MNYFYYYLKFISCMPEPIKHLKVYKIDPGLWKRAIATNITKKGIYLHGKNKHYLWWKIRYSIPNLQISVFFICLFCFNIHALINICVRHLCSSRSRSWWQWCWFTFFKNYFNVDCCSSTFIDCLVSEVLFSIRHLNIREFCT